MAHILLEESLIVVFSSGQYNLFILIIKKKWNNHDFQRKGPEIADKCNYNTTNQRLFAICT